MVNFLTNYFKKESTFWLILLIQLKFNNRKGRLIKAMSEVCCFDILFNTIFDSNNDKTYVGKDDDDDDDKEYSCEEAFILHYNIVFELAEPGTIVGVRSSSNATDTFFITDKLES